MDSGSNCLEGSKGQEVDKFWDCLDSESELKASTTLAEESNSVDPTPLSFLNAPSLNGIFGKGSKKIDDIHLRLKTSCGIHKRQAAIAKRWRQKLTRPVCRVLPNPCSDEVKFSTFDFVSFKKRLEKAEIGFVHAMEEIKGIITYGPWESSMSRIDPIAMGTLKRLRDIIMREEEPVKDFISKP